MGRLSAIDMIENASTEQALVWHFQSNHYPPLPMSLVPVALRIIKGQAKGKTVRLPKGITYKGKQNAPIGDCIEAWHLQEFMEDESE